MIWFLVLGLLGWLSAIYESKRYMLERDRYLRERDGRRYDAEVYESEIRRLRQDAFAEKIQRSKQLVDVEPANTALVPRDAWESLDRGTRH